MSRRKKCQLIILCGLLLYILAAVYFWNQRFIHLELEAPLDHVKTAFQRPFLSCPVIPPIDDASSVRVPIYMLSARPREQVLPILESWKGLNVTLVDTQDFSAKYRNTQCLHLTFKSRLFAVYQYVIRTALSSSSESSHIVLLEDDVKLLNRHAFLSELSWAVEHNVEYYSFRQSRSDGSCLYSHGTVAQVARRSFLQELLEVERETFCRLPIDMYIAKRGPWYETQRSIVEHVGKRFIVPHQ